MLPRTVAKNLFLKRNGGRENGKGRIFPSFFSYKAHGKKRFFLKCFSSFFNHLASKCKDSAKTRSTAFYGNTQPPFHVHNIIHRLNKEGCVLYKGQKVMLPVRRTSTGESVKWSGEREREREGSPGLNALKKSNK